MIKALIAEDEKVEREALKKLLNNNFADSIEVVGQAKTGLETIELCKKNQPDLVLMDIQMPEMDGLEASKKVKELFKDIEIVIVTAYSTFDYAKKALKIGVVDYLVKPYSLKTLKQVMNRVEEKISEKVKNRNKFDLLSDKARSLSRMLEYEFIIKIIREKHLQGKKLESFFEKLEINCSYYFCALFHFKEYLTPNTERSLEKMFGDLQSRVLYSAIFDTVVIFTFNDNLQSISQDKRKLWNLGKEDSIRSLFNYQISSVETDLSKLHQVYSNIVRKLNKENGEVTKKLKTFELEKKLCDSIIAKDSSKAVEQVLEIITLINMYYDRKLSRVHQHLRELNGYIIRVVSQFIGVEVQAKEVCTFSLTNLINCNSLKETNQYMIRYVTEMIVYLEVIQKEKNNDVMQIAKLYIKNNYMEDISLSDVANFVGLSKSYFSRKFKKVESINFKDYLVRIRMEEAIALIRGGGLTIAEVAYAVGYIEPGYFSKAFKKYTGLSPTDFN